MSADCRLRVRASTLCLLVLWLLPGCSESPMNPGDDPGDTPSNTAPTAAAGTDQSVSVGYGVRMDGSASADADGDALTYAWTLTAPSGSAAALDDATSATPSFTPDVEGAYTLGLVVNDGTEDSSADAATVTATDNAVMVPVAAASGGTVQDPSGSFTLDIPAGALSADTDITVTPLAASQRPAELADLPGDLTVYDMQPSGLTFSTPATFTVEVPSGVTESATSIQASGALLYSESGGVIEPLADATWALDPADPGQAIVTGRVDHFSWAILFERGEMLFLMDGFPAMVEDGDTFTVEATIDVTNADIGSLVTAGYRDVSTSPVEGDSATFAPVGTSVTHELMFTCSGVGTGEARGLLSFQTDDEFQSAALVGLGKEVDCVAPPTPIVQTFVSLPRAGRLLPVPGDPNRITVGGGIRVVELNTGMVLEDTTLFGADREEWVGALSDGTYLSYSLLGKVWHVDVIPDTAVITPVHGFDQARHMAAVAPDVYAVVSAYGELGLMQYQGNASVTDPFRDLGTTGPTGQALYLQAVWAGPPGSYTYIGAVTDEGPNPNNKGDAAIATTRAAILEADPMTGSVTAVPLDGVIDFIIDADVRHAFDLDCREGGPDDLLCVFTSGFENIADNSNPNQDRINDGYVAIFSVDLQSQTANTLFWDYGNARVGGAIYDRGNGDLGIAVANQATERVEVWFLEGEEIQGSWEIDIEGCPNLADFLATGDAEYAAVTCQVLGVSDLAGVTILQNLKTWIPPVS